MRLGSLGTPACSFAGLWPYVLGLNPHPHFAACARAIRGRRQAWYSTSHLKLTLLQVELAWAQCNFMSMLLLHTGLWHRSDTPLHTSNLHPCVGSM